MSAPDFRGLVAIYHRARAIREHHNEGARRAVRFILDGTNFGAPMGEACRPQYDVDHGVPMVFDPDADQGRGGWVTTRPVFTGELYRVVETPSDPTTANGSWRWAGTGWGRPRTYRTLRAARSVASRLRAQYARAGVQMEVAVQRAPVGQWEVVA
ncbi:hypothetical protein [Pseudonocardia sp. NPDC049154]|uniref:hypothetical protein n=1 Tax=Pseudonocardia sp. NPDC049154 TaxID=3155501 RepID=UPI003403B62A